MYHHHFEYYWCWYNRVKLTRTKGNQLVVSELYEYMMSSSDVGTNQMIINSDVGTKKSSQNIKPVALVTPSIMNIIEHHTGTEGGMLFGVSKNNNNNKRPLTLKSMPPTGMPFGLSDLVLYYYDDEGIE